jgi:peptidoglycan/LPS O-acetylase OafA/YrhL
MWNAAPFFHPATPVIPGVFENGPYKDAVNGSLWTLRYEVLCYVMLGFAAVFGRRGVRIFMIGSGIFALAVFAQAFGADQNKLNDRYLFLLDFFTLGWLATFAAAFAFGAWLRDADDRRLGQVVVISVLVMALGWRDATMHHWAAVFFFGSLAVWAGRKLNLDRVITRGQDISYGVYIYAFPVQQLAVRWVQPQDNQGFLVYYAVATGVTVLLAALSWVLVERPALLLKGPVSGVLEGLFGGNRRHLAQQTGGLRGGVDPVDAHAVLGRGDRH